MATPQEIIENIRRKEFLIGVKMSPEIEEGARNMRLNLNNALRTLSEDLYSKDTHFVLELVQNADDNEYASTVEPEISFQLFADRLLIQNNELGFTEPNVLALCRVGQSTKPKSEGFIGEKGIGFKSVFTATNRPEIHSNGFHFRFDRTDPSLVLGYVVPHWCGDQGYPDALTTIALPAKQGGTFTAEKLVDLSDELLLFLRKLRRIMIADKTTGITQIYKRTDVSETVTLESTRFDASGAVRDLSLRKFKYLRHNYSTTDIAEDRRQDIHEAAIVLAFPVTDTGTASAESTQNLFAFLPVRNYGFRFIIQGDFLLNSSREDVHRDPVWNKRARHEISSAFLSAVSEFKSDSVLSRSFLQFIPRMGDVTDPFFAEADARILSDLKNTACLLSESGAWCKPNEVITADDEFKALFPNDELKRILGLEYLSGEIQAPPGTLKRLGVVTAGVHSHLLRLIEKDTRISERPANWLRALYRYCDKKFVSDVPVKKFQSLAAVKLDGGAFCKLTETTVYFPLQRGHRYGFEHEFPLLHPDLVLGEDAEEVAKFLTRVGVKQSEPYSLIVHHILPRHAGEDWKTSQISALIGHVAYIKDHLPQFLKGTIQAGKSQEFAFEQLRTGVYLQTKKSVDDTTYFARPREMYLGQEYRPPIPLETLLGPSADPVKFVADVYLASSKRAGDEISEESRSWRDFFYQIGVNSHPVVEELVFGMDYGPGSELSALLTSDDPKVQKNGIEIVDRNWSYYSKFLEARSTARRGYVITSASQFLQFLRNVSAPCRKRGEFKLQETYLDIDHVRVVFGNSAAYLGAEVSNTGFLDAVNVTHRVDAAACIKRLDQLRAVQSVSKKDVKVIYRQLERLFASEKNLISAAFSQTPRVYVPTHAQWFTTDQVVWESSGSFLDNQYPPLAAAYKEYETFFCRYLNVQRQPTESALIRALVNLAQYGETPEARKSEAFKIYRRLVRVLHEARAGNSDVEPDWLGSLRTEAVFLDTMDRLVEVSNDIYIADEPRLADAFKEHERISLLNVDSWQIPQIQDLLTACGMPKLSSVAKYSLSAAEGASPDSEVTRRIRQRTSHLMRFVYARAHGAFDWAARQGLWRSLRSLEVRTVSTLEVDADVSGYRVRVPTDIYRHEEVIYVQANTRGKFDKVAQELCLYLGTKPEQLSEGIYRILTAASDDDIHEFFEVKGIPDIPHQDLVIPTVQPESQLPESEAIEEHLIEEVNETQEQVVSHETPVPIPNSSTERSMPEAGSLGGIGNPETEPSRGDSESATTGPLGTSGQGGSTELPAPTRRERERKPSGRLLSYAEPVSGSRLNHPQDNSHEERMGISRAAVDFVLEQERKDGRDVVEMPPTNEGFDIRRASEGGEEYIEVKGLSGAWGAEGIILTPPELRMAERQRERFWLFVVEYATDPLKRQLHKIRDPFGQTNQFRFDSGWKSVASGAPAESLAPTIGRRIFIEGLGVGTILSVIQGGALLRLTVRLDSGSEVTRTYDPTKMTVSEPE